jgi:DNA polymerase-3 subunit alpha
MENIPQYCDVKNGRKPRESIHSLIDHILDETQGIIVYQEQVMQIAQDMAGYTLGGADLLRRAMGKKIQAAMDEERPKFIAGALANGVDEAKALEVWNLLDKFANYGFNKSHAAAYALVSYQTAWLKANYPEAFMASVMNCDLAKTDKLTGFVSECRKMGISVSNPCVNRSLSRFSLDGREIVYGLGAIKNVGPDAIDLLVQARGDQPFQDLWDMARRVDLKKIGKRALEMLIRVGAFDKLHKNRKELILSMPSLMTYSREYAQMKSSSQGALFEDEIALAPPQIEQSEDWSFAERLSEEMRALEYYLSGHPLDPYRDQLKEKEVLSLDALSLKTHKQDFMGRVSGTVLSVEEKISKSKKRMAYVRISDGRAEIEMRIFADQLKALGITQAKSMITQSFVFTISAQQRDERIFISVKEILPVDLFLSDSPHGFDYSALYISIQTEAAVHHVSDILKQPVKSEVAFLGDLYFRVSLSLEKEYLIKADENITISAAMVEHIRSLSGVESVVLQ